MSGANMSQRVNSLLGSDQACDVLVVGGGINGAGIARDLAGRGWRVVLCEQDDLGAHTSSSSSKLIHGGLRYLEYREFGLVRKALLERERLLRSAPHIMWPMRFVLPHDAHMRPAWMIRMGLWLYDHLAPRRFLPGCEAVDLSRSALGEPLQPQWQRGFVYSDGWVDDARLVVLCAMDASELGASILTRTRCTHITPDGDGWCATLQSQGAREPTILRARAVVNAAGPWVERVLRDGMGVRSNPTHLRLVKGSHIVVPRCTKHDHAYILQGEDGRIVFVIPYEQDFTLIGTTDVAFQGDPSAVRIDDDEVTYLCQTVNRYLRQAVTPQDVRWSYAGVRPLLDDAQRSASAVTRDYRLQVSDAPAPWLTVWGGKITTFRVLAEQAANQVGALLGAKRLPWTAHAWLPGGNLLEHVNTDEVWVHPQAAFAGLQAHLLRQLPWLDHALAYRWCRAYGGRVFRMLAHVTQPEGLGREVAPGLHEIELSYLQRHEWARTAEDILWRRSKLGLHYTPSEQQAVADWLMAQG